jgi:hypothetical protein
MEETIQYNGETYTLFKMTQKFSDIEYDWQSVCSEQPVYEFQYTNGTTKVIRFISGDMRQIGQLIV